jgi:hypothetical protein
MKNGLPSFKIAHNNMYRSLLFLFAFTFSSLSSGERVKFTSDFTEVLLADQPLTEILVVINKISIVKDLNKISRKKWEVTCIVKEGRELGRYGLRVGDKLTIFIHSPTITFGGKDTIIGQSRWLSFYSKPSHVYSGYVEDKGRMGQRGQGAKN